MIELIITSFVAGVLTVAAPCILPLLPVIIGGSMLRGPGEAAQKSIKQPLVITISLALSIVVFSLLLKATTTLLSVPVIVWSIISGGIIILFGITLLVPSIWERLMIATGWQAGANRLMARSQQTSGIAKDILLGSALGPVFNSCSPTYALIIAIILPASLSAGITYLAAYAVGVASILLLLSLFGRTLADRLKWLSNPSGVFKKTIGVLFILVGIGIIFGVDKRIQSYVLENGWYDPVMRIEESFRE